MAKSKKPVQKSDTPADAGTELIEKFEFPEDPNSNPAEVKPEPVAEVKPVEPVVPVKPAHPSYLTRAAKAAGFSDAEIDEMPTADLKEAVNIVAMTRQTDQRQRENDASRQRDDSGRFVKQPDAPAPEFDLGKELGVKTDDWNEETRAILTPVVKHLAGQIAELKDQLTKVNERDQNRERNAHFDKLDQLFVQNEDLFGKGQRTDLDRDSDELARRVAVIGEMTRMQAADNGLSLKEAFHKATKRLNYVSAPKPAAPAAPAPEPARDVTVPDPHGFLNGSTIVPASRATKPEPKGVKLAEANLAARMRERAVAVDTTEHDELPD